MFSCNSSTKPKISSRNDCDYTIILPYSKIDKERLNLKGDVKTIIESNDTTHFDHSGIIGLKNTLTEKDSSGKVLRVVEILGNMKAITEFYYDSKGQIIKEKYTYPEGEMIISYGCYDNLPSKTYKTDETTRTEVFNRLGFKILDIYNSGDGAQEEIEYFRSNKNEIDSTITKKYYSANDIDFKLQIYRYVFDTKGNWIKMTILENEKLIEERSRVIEYY